jgi:hypothetical protein
VLTSASSAACISGVNGGASGAHRIACIDDGLPNHAQLLRFDLLVGHISFLFSHIFRHAFRWILSRDTHHLKSEKVHSNIQATFLS